MVTSTELFIPTRASYSDVNSMVNLYILKKRQKCCYSKGVVPSKVVAAEVFSCSEVLSKSRARDHHFLRGPNPIVSITRYDGGTRCQCRHVNTSACSRTLLRRLMHDFVVDAFDDVVIEGSLAIAQPSFMMAQHLWRKLPSRAHRSSPSTRSVDVRREE